MALSQGLQQKLLQKLSPQQIQLMKLLQVPTAFLEERIKEELEDNPALEQGAEEFNQEEYKEEYETDTETDPDGSEEEYDQIDISEYVSEGDDEVADYRTREDAYQGSEDHQTIPIKTETSFHDLLIQQLVMLNLDEHQQIIAEQIVGSIDDDGYLRRTSSAIVNDLAFLQNIESTEEEVEQLIEQVQQFEPHGICARTLQECLLIQLRIKSKKRPTKIINAAIAVMDQYFDEFSRKHFDKIQKQLELSADELREAVQLITRLNPKPGGTVGSDQKSEYYIIPDFYIFNNNGTLELTLHNKNAPDLKISEDYREMLLQYEKGSKKDKRQKEAVQFIKQKIDAAKWFIDAIKQRQSTLLLTMNAIMDYQQNFFLSGDETALRPMILKDIAEVTGLDISTISRVANSKFVQTEFGTHRLKFFFSESLTKTSGEEVSTHEVKHILAEMIHSEQKNNPLSDDQLTEMLSEKGYHIARRTVAKYREQLGIPVARLRKNF
ncbi:MAG: RNA polymerase factor sigma-54 [Bacteroidota bacterium]